MIIRALRSLLLLVCSIALVTAASGSRADAQSKSKKILYVTHSAGFKHAVLPHSEQVFPELGTKAGWFTVDVTQEVREAQRRGPQTVRRRRVLHHRRTPDHRPAESRPPGLRRRRQRLHRHPQRHGERPDKWPWDGTMLGAYFDGHPWTQRSPSRSKIKAPVNETPRRLLRDRRRDLPVQGMVAEQRPRPLEIGYHVGRHD